MVKKVGVLILGYHSNEHNWGKTLWGIPPSKPGRLVRGIKEILEHKAAIAIITSGIGHSGKTSAQLAEELLYQRLDSLSEFREVYPILGEYLPKDIRRILKKKLVLVEEYPFGTASSLIPAGEALMRAAIDQVIIVTSPDHISRSARDALTIWQKAFPHLAKDLLFAASVTGYTEEDRKTPHAMSGVENVVVIEPRVVRINTLAKKLFKLSEEKLRSMETIIGS